MSQIITCPSCRQQLQVPEAFLGQPVKCPGCGFTFSVLVEASVPAMPSESAASTEPALRHGPSERPPAPGGDVQRLLLPPAICLLLLSLLGLCCTLYNVAHIVVAAEAIRAQAQQAAPPDPFARQIFFQMVDFMLGPGGIALRVLFMVLNVITLFGSAAMMNRRLYGLAVLGSVCALVSNLDICCCVPGFPLGLWALLVLCRPEVKAAFS